MMLTQRVSRVLPAFALLAVLAGGMAMPTLAQAEGTCGCSCPCSIPPAQTSDATPVAPGFLAVSIPTLRATQLIPADKQIATAYINTQLALYGLSFSEYLSLDTAIQRRILELPGRQSPLTREEAKKIVRHKISVPSKVTETLQANTVLSEDVISSYAVTLPYSVTKTTDEAPTQRMLIADHYILLDASTRKIIDVMPL